MHINYLLPDVDGVEIIDNDYLAINGYIIGKHEGHKLILASTIDKLYEIDLSNPEFVELYRKHVTKLIDLYNDENSSK